MKVSSSFSAVSAAIRSMIGVSLSLMNFSPCSRVSHTAGPTSLLAGGTEVINLTRMLQHTVTAEEAGLSVLIATVELLDRDPTAGGATSITCFISGLQDSASEGVATLTDTGDATLLHRDITTITLIGRGTLTEGDTVFIGCESFAGDNDEAAGSADLLLEHVSS
jgi:hypothetical protein